MKKQGARQYILVVWDLLLVLVRLVFVCIALLLSKLNLLLMRCQFRLVDNEPPKVDRDTASSKTDCDCSLKECGDDLDWFVDTIEKADNGELAYIREQLEATASGQKYVAESKRLYCILVPTRAENTNRIKNIMNLASHEETLTMIHDIRASMCG